MKTRLSLLFVLTLGLAVFANRASAQADEFNFFVRRNFGYGGGSQIQGSFRMEATGPATLTSVTFSIDDAPIGAITQAPFRLDFRTETHGPGWHTLSAVGQTSDGRTLTAPTKRLEFVTAADSWRAVGGIVGPLFAVLGVALALGLGIQFLMLNRGGAKTHLPLGAARNYGPWGGAICPKCQRPFSRHLWGLNFGFYKFDRCDHCGRWSFVARATPAQLAAAEAAEAQMAQPEQPVAELSPEEKLKRQIDESRFDAGQ